MVVRQFRVQKENTTLEMDKLVPHAVLESTVPMENRKKIALRATTVLVVRDTALHVLLAHHVQHRRLLLVQLGHIPLGYRPPVRTVQQENTARLSLKESSLTALLVHTQPLTHLNVQYELLDRNVVQRLNQAVVVANTLLLVNPLAPIVVRDSPAPLADHLTMMTQYLINADLVSTEVQRA